MDRRKANNRKIFGLNKPLISFRTTSSQSRQPRFNNTYTGNSTAVLYTRGSSIEDDDKQFMHLSKLRDSSMKQSAFGSGSVRNKLDSQINRMFSSRKGNYKISKCPSKPRLLESSKKVVSFKDLNYSALQQTTTNRSMSKPLNIRSQASLSSDVKKKSELMIQIDSECSIDESDATPMIPRRSIKLKRSLTLKLQRSKIKMKAFLGFRKHIQRKDQIAKDNITFASSPKKLTISSDEEEIELKEKVKMDRLAGEVRLVSSKGTFILIFRATQLYEEEVLLRALND